MDRLPLSDHTQLSSAIGLELSQTMGGSSSVLLAIFYAAARSARNGADKTSDMLQARAGRAAYISAKQLEGQAEPGAEAVARLFEHLAT